MQAVQRRVASFGRAKECLGRAGLPHRHVGTAGNVDDWVADLARAVNAVSGARAATKARRGAEELRCVRRPANVQQAMLKEWMRRPLAQSLAQRTGEGGRRRPVRYSKSRGEKGCW